MSGDMTTFCFYHGADLDGQCSGALVKIAYPEAIMWPIDYGQAFPWDLIHGELMEHGFGAVRVVMVDFGLQPFDQMLALANMVGERNLVWIDHHKSAIESYQASADQRGIDWPGRRFTSSAACELTWLHFFGEQPMPEAVRLLGRYDVWDHADPRVLPFQMGCRAMDLDPRTRMGEWRDLMQLWNDRDTYIMLEERCAAGRAILEYQAQQRKRSGDRMFVVELNGLRCLAMNQLGSSQMFDGWYDPEQHDAMLPFGYVPGVGWKCSLYSTKAHVDCASVAKARGGGGHKGAAGWSGINLPAELAVGMLAAAGGA